MNEPNLCANCGNPIAPNQMLCPECFVNEYLDEEMAGETWNQPNLYDETWDDSEFDEMDFDDD